MFTSSTTKQIVLESGKTIDIRQPKLSDVESMLALINDLAREDIFLNANPEHIFTKSEEEQYVRDCIERINQNMQVHFLAFFKTELIGSVVVTKQSMRQKHVGIFGITIAKKWRGMSVGKHLSLLALKQASIIGIKMVVLDAFADNQIAVKLYKKLGFKAYGLLPNGFSYKNTYKDKILMYKEV